MKNRAEISEGMLQREDQDGVFFFFSVFFLADLTRRHCYFTHDNILLSGLLLTNFVDEGYEVVSSTRSVHKRGMCLLEPIIGGVTNIDLGMSKHS